MARNANENINTPSETDVQAAVRNIESRYTDMLTERGVYMQKCKRIRENMQTDYEEAVNRGISRKLLRKIIRERELERKIFGLTDGLEEDERSEHEMLMEKLGEF